jgi:glycosyltransferase involved in cell wall biosynthesis
LNHRLTFIVPGDPGQRTGGYLFDARIVDELRGLGWRIEVVGLEGRFPDVDELARGAMARVLAGMPDGARVVIDGLALGGVPDAVLPHADRLDITALVHHPLADETGLKPALRERLLGRETSALAACRRVIVTSAFTAMRLGELGLDSRPPVVVEPGVETADLAGPVADRLAGREPGGPERLLCVASLTPRKGQDILVGALAGLVERRWHCVLAGSSARDEAFAMKVVERIAEAGLEARVECIGECQPDALDAAYHSAGLCVLPSRYEGYGMVVTEALARGLPVITTTGGALAETAPDDCCLKVAPGDFVGLREALAGWFDDAQMRLSMTRAAVARRETLRDWKAAGREFALALDRDPG